MADRMQEQQTESEVSLPAFPTPLVETAIRTVQRRTPKRPIRVEDYEDGMARVVYNTGQREWQTRNQLQSQPKAVRLLDKFLDENYYFVTRMEATPKLHRKPQGYRFQCSEKLTLDGRPHGKAGLVWKSPVLEVDELPEGVRRWLRSSNGRVLLAPYVSEDLRTDLDFVLAPRDRATHPSFEVVRYQDVESIVAKHPIGSLGDFVYRVKFRNSRREDEWLSSSHLNFIPNDEVIPTVPVLSNTNADEVESKEGNISRIILHSSKASRRGTTHGAGTTGRLECFPALFPPRLPDEIA